MKKDYSPTDPREHVQEIRDRLQTLIDQLHGYIRKIDEPQARALFETSAEVLEGLKTAFAHYEDKSEPAWR